jgi:subtilisin-like proprotein convertase family protein
MKTAFTLATLLVIACSGVALAVDEKIEDGLPPAQPVNQLPCLTEGYKQYTVTPNIPVPDNNPAGVSSVITISETGTVLDAIVSFEMGHTWIGDLIATVTFQPACGGPSIGPVRLLCRQNRTGGCFNTTGGAGCSANLSAANDYEWSDAAADELGEPTCPSSSTILASGCYRPDDDAPGINFPLSVFDGLDKAGCWTLNISDNAGADTGTLVSWTLSLNNEVVPRGACCYADGSCVDGALEGDCTAGGGLWYDGLACSDISCVNAAEARSWGGVKAVFR